ncbi:MerR family transcriptional regulator [Actinoplanes sp. DH11]|uniref:MerR family transcriptional regulator n=1 Tax=Actinoplanes sp. DH11 TaxID=2857011 RepID=UPI001E3C1830|nr:MerR family transcriptional regulator [Actinoplanes sp. DH11]
MRSREVAELAGVTVRTLRHYHRLGILPEPPRSSNGYREYDLGTLARLLRIKRLTGLGIPLGRVAALLDDGGTAGAATGDVLDELDRELRDRIDRLTRQREIIAEVRSRQVSADVPAGAERYLARLAANAPELHATERDHAVLVHHLIGDTEVVTELYARMSDPGQLDVMAQVARQFAALHDGSGDDAIERAASDLAALLAPLAATVTADTAPVVPLGVDFWTGSLTGPQRAVIQRLGELLAADPQSGAAGKPS